MNKNALIAIIGIVILAGGYFILRGTSPQPPTTQTPQSQVSGNGQMVMMNSGAFFLSPKEIRAKVGQPITVHVTAQGQHTFTIDELGVNVPTPSGKTTAVEFTPNKKGVFTFYCAIPGHRENGQVGTLTVE